jgi:hypothetical protein
LQFFLRRWPRKARRELIFFYRSLPKRFLFLLTIVYLFICTGFFILENIASNRDVLTRREKEILQKVFDFDGDLVLASSRLYITKGTLRSVLYQKIFTKLLVNSLTGAFRVGLLNGWISLEASAQANPPNLFQN